MNPLKLFTQRKVRATAYAWKTEKLHQLDMEMEIQWKLLESLHRRKAELAALQGSELAARFLCETPDEIEKVIQGKHDWLEELKAMWCWSKHPLQTPDEYASVSQIETERARLREAERKAKASVFAMKGAA